MSSMLHVRLDETLKAQGNKALAEMGLTAAEAVRLLYHRIVSDQSFPLELKVPNKTTQSAISEADAIMTRRKARFRNGAGLCQGFRASQKSRRRSQLSPSFKAQIQKLSFSFSLHPHVRTEGHPLHGLRSSVRSQPHGCHSMPGPNLVPGYLSFTRIQR